MSEYLNKKFAEIKKNADVKFFVVWAIVEIIIGVYLGIREDGFYPGLFSIIVGIILFNIALFKKRNDV